MHSARPSNFLPDKADAIVIGGGIIGLLTAARLREAGLDTVVLEAANLGSGQSGRNLGFIRSQGRNAAESKLMVRSLELWDELSRRLGRDLSFRRAGHLSLAADRQAAEEVSSWSGIAARNRIRFESQSAEALRGTAPWLTDGYIEAGYTPDDGQAEPADVMRELGIFVRALGAKVFEQTRVISLKVNGNSVAGVKTSVGEIASRTIVLATGAWTRRLLAVHGVVLPTHAGHATLAATKPVPNFVGQTVWEVGRLGFRQDSRGRLVFGFGGYVDIRVRWEDLCSAFTLLPEYLRNRGKMKLHVGQPLARDVLKAVTGRQLHPFEWRENEPNYGQAAAGLDRLSAVLALPFSGKLELETAWSGLIDVTADHLPAIGDVGIEGLVVAAGMSGHGFGLAPSLAENIAALALRQSHKASALANFAPDRLRGFRPYGSPRYVKY